MGRTKDPVEAYLQGQRDLRSETHLTLGRLISYLEHTEDHLVPNLENPHSYRGYYTDLAFNHPTREISSKVLLSTCRDLVGRRFVGYKGGRYKMGLVTPLWIANYGDCGVPLLDFSGKGITTGGSTL